MTIANWDSNPDNNNAAPPQGAPENTTLVSDLNDIARQIMADVRAWYELQWTDLGLAFEATGGGNAIVLTGDQSQYFEVNQRVQFLDGGGTKVATITDIAVATNTTLTVSVAVTHPVSQLWNGVKPSILPVILTADLAGNHISGSIASGVTATTQSEGDNSEEVATTEYADRAAGQAIGVGQDWEDVKTSRAFDTVYQNTTGVPIMVSVTAQSGGSTGQFSIRCEDTDPPGKDIARVQEIGTVTIIVPNNFYYLVTEPPFVPTLLEWYELR